LRFFFDFVRDNYRFDTLVVLCKMFLHPTNISKCLPNGLISALIPFEFYYQKSGFLLMHSKYVDSSDISRVLIPSLGVIRST